jgi:hypothetical protein
MLVTGALDATRTYAYVPRSDPSQPWDGVLTLVEETGVRVRRTITDRYGLEEQPCDSFPGRVFLLCKEDRAGDLDTAAGRAAAERCGEVYPCSVGRHVGLCTCPGFAAGHRTCKHLAVIAACLEHGAFPDALSDGVRDEGDPREQGDPGEFTDAPRPFGSGD